MLAFAAQGSWEENLGGRTSEVRTREEETLVRGPDPHLIPHPSRAEE